MADTSRDARDVPKEQPSAVENKPNVDALELLKEFKSTVGAKATDGAASSGDTAAGTAAVAENASGERSVARASGDNATASGDSTATNGDNAASPESRRRDAGDKGERDEKAEDAARSTENADSIEIPSIFPEEGETRAKKKAPVERPRPKGGDLKKETPEEPAVTVIGDTKVDPNKVTVAFLDDFKKPEFANGLSVTSHGDTSARPVEANGFNVLRMQGGETTIDKQLKQVESMVASGKLPLGKGDFLNVSMAGNEPSFDFVSKVTGMNITPENLAQNKDALLNKFGDLAKTHPDKDVRAAFQAIVDSNASIKRLQDKGITVINAAGNTGQNTFDLMFMNAKVQLGSEGPDGKPDAFSAKHSLMTPGGDGVIGVKAVPPSIFSPDMARDNGSLEMVIPGGKNVSFPITNARDSFATNSIRFNREEMTFGKDLEPIFPTENKVLPTSFMRADDTSIASTFTKAPKGSFGGGTIGAPSTEGLSWITPIKTVNANDRISFSDAEPAAAKGEHVAGAVVGTSFANVGYLIKNREEFERIKRAAR